MEDNFNCGDRIKELRKSRSLSQERLALNAGITTAYLGLIERGKRNPTVITIKRICLALNISLAEFFNPAETVYELDVINGQLYSQIVGLDDEEKNIILQIIKQIVHLREHGIQKNENEHKNEHCYD